MLRVLPTLVILALWIYAFIDCLNTPEEQVRNLPKVVWVIIILLFGTVLVGPVAWLIAGRPQGPVAAAYRRQAPPTRSVAPDDDPEFLASLDRNINQHEDMLKDWEADLRRREEELRRGKEGGPEDNKPPAHD